MRSKIFVLVTIFLSGIIIYSCEPETYKPIGEPFNKIEGIQGSWKITSVVQVDEVAISKDLSFTQIDITGFYDFSNYRITFNTNEEDNPSTFLVENPDNIPNFLNLTGKWAFDNSDYPSMVYLIKLDALEVPIDTTRLPLNSTPRKGNPLKFSFTRFSGGEKIISYKYTFEKVNE
jgi:hypothetical protein